ncbi:MAG TPA: hypothetical protein VHC71_02910 [Hyphomicrobium sp.]|nr:hypothetical protein [Hyphomicrobium sp.]
MAFPDFASQILNQFLVDPWGAAPYWPDRRVDGCIDSHCIAAGERLFEGLVKLLVQLRF